MAKTEDIEAKLAAYVDGDLDAAGRAEIEKHLSNNTQHRRLIRELMQHRDLLKNLPREMAPAEVCESINAQLERAVLLGDVDGEAEASTMRIRPWHQFRAIAAILVLTACLAAVIAMLLPRPGSKPGEIADLRALPAPTQRSADTVLSPAPPPSLEPGRDPEVLVAQPEVATKASEAPTIAMTPSEAAAPTTAPRLADETATEQQRRATLALSDPLLRGGFGANGVAGGPVNPAEITRTNSELPGNQMFSPLVNRVDLSSTRNISEPLVLTVPSDNPAFTNQKVTEYLTRNNINWEAQAEPMPQPLEIPRTQMAYGARFNQQQVQLKNGGEGMGAAGGGGGFAGAGRGGRGGGVAESTDLNQAAQQAPQTPADRGFANVPSNEQRQAAAGPARQNDTQFRVFDPAENNRQIVIGGEGNNFLQQQQQQQAASQQEQRILAKKLTSEQLSELQTTLSKLNETESQPHPLSIVSNSLAGASGDNIFRDKQVQGVMVPATMPGVGESRVDAKDELGNTPMNRARETAAPTTMRSDLLTLVFPHFNEFQPSGRDGNNTVPFRDAFRLDLSREPGAKTAGDASAIAAIKEVAGIPTVGGELRDVVIVVQPQPATQPATMPADAPAN